MNPSQRLLPIDTVRGTAMLFVCISHISYFFIVSSPEISALFRALGFFATPNFLLMSGLACGYQLSRSPSSATAVRILDRGLFVLLVGHLVVAASLYYIVLPGTAFEHVVITDTIGLMLCTAPIVRYLPARQLLPAGTTIFLLSSLVGLAWRPTSTAGAAFGGILLGVDVKILPDPGWITATLPLFGFFLIGVGTGKFVNELRVTGRCKAIWTRLALVGSLAIAAAVLMNLTRHFTKSLLLGHFGTSAWVPPLLAMLDVRQKMPPSPAYGLFYGGIGITLVGLIGVLPTAKLPTPIERWIGFAAVLGRASFVSYVSQQWLIEFTPYWLGLEGRLRSPAVSLVYLFVVILVMFCIARAWDRRQGNRFLTVGLKAIQHLHTASPAARHVN